jgi:hypothetical protein
MTISWVTATKSSWWNCATSFYGIATIKRAVLPTRKRTDIAKRGACFESSQIENNGSKGARRNIEYISRWRGYVKTRKSEMEKCLAGFMVVMYGDGRHYIVETDRMYKTFPAYARQNIAHA